MPGQLNALMNALLITYFALGYMRSLFTFGVSHAHYFWKLFLNLICNVALKLLENIDIADPLRSIRYVSL